jgi:hypothetical protein
MAAPFMRTVPEKVAAGMSIAPLAGQGSVVGHAWPGTGQFGVAVPVQLPSAVHASPVVQAMPSSQAVPVGATISGKVPPGSWQAP